MKTASNSTASPARANTKASPPWAPQSQPSASKTFSARKQPNGLLVLLDGIEDPHNVGAIVRTALAAGANGVVIPERRAAGLTDTVERASAGALAHLPVARVKNLVRAMEEMKEVGYWLVGLDERAEKNYTEVDYKGSVGIVLGSEGEGLHELTRKRCDFLVSLPTTGPVKSLNVSVAAGVMLFEAVRQRRAAATKSASSHASTSAGSPSHKKSLPID